VPELRQNIITGDWVVIAPERAKRPNDFVFPESVKVTKKGECPFCIDSPGYKANEEVRKAKTEHFYVIENKFPAFVEDETKSEIRSFYPEKNFYRARPSVGDHEVVVYNNHEKSLITMPKKHLAEMFEVIQMRCIAIEKEKGVASIMPIYNHGALAGASIDHPHAQIFASGIIANTVGREMDGAEKYFDINGICVFCDIIKHEIKEKVRLVYENDEFIAFTSYAARFPMETWVMPKAHESQFEETSKTSLEAFADVVNEVVVRLNQNIPNVPLNFYIHTLPTTLDDSASYHWHLEVVPRIANYGGYELGSGVIIDIMSPEKAAEYLRKPSKNK